MILAILAVPAAAQPTKLPYATPESVGIRSDRLSEIEKIVTEGIQQKNMPGAVVLIGHRGRIVYHRAFGHRQLLPEPLPMRCDTLFDMASITKPLATATSVMILIERGVIGLDDKVADHIPEFAAGGKQDVTIRQLLLHVGGLTPDNGLADYADGPEKSMEKILALGLNYEPGTRFRYSDVGFEVLGELVRRKAGQDLNQFARENIYQPLGMTETGYLPAEPLRERAVATEQRDGHWMVGEVHDPRAFALGGVAGHAGLFSTAADLAVYAQMMIGQGEYQGVRILRPETVQTMTAAYDVPGGKRGLGWDKRSGYSSNRGDTMSDSAFGHGGFTGTVLWIDPGRDLFVIFLSNRVHPDGKGSVNQLAGRIGTIAADALGTFPGDEADADKPVACGIDVLRQSGFELLQGRRVGLITNQTGLAADGRTTASLLHEAPGVKLVALFSPEHGLAGKLDQSNITDSTDPETGLPVFSLYGADRRPTPESLQDVDTLVFDIQDIGCRFYTYISTMGEAMRAAGEHKIRFVVLDRPNPIGGVDVAGPVLDAGEESFVGYHTLPVRHGMTVGEIARLLSAERGWNVDLHVIRCENWRRDRMFDSTGLVWVNPSPNMRNLNQAMLYPGVGLLEFTNLSVGRGTDTPFEWFGAPWLDPVRVAGELNTLQLPGVTFIPTYFTPESSKFSGQRCGGVRILITDRKVLDPLPVGYAIALALHRLHPDDWQMRNYQRLLSSQAVYDSIDRLDPLSRVLEISQQGLREFLQRREGVLLY